MIRADVEDGNLRPNLVPVSEAFGPAEEAQVKRLICVTGFGAGDSRGRRASLLIDRPSPSLDRIYQLGLWSAIFFAIFLRLPPNKSPDSAGRFTSFDPVGFAIFATLSLGCCNGKAVT
jgi:hypothetical protein